MTTNTDLTPLADIMAQLRDPDHGCPWDIEQDFSTIAAYTIEEAYEVVDAIERNDLDALKDELGDLLLQVVFHSQMALEHGAFTLQDVIDGICKKMIRRHPHIFGESDTDTVSEVSKNWENIKARERSINEDNSALAGVAAALPALLRAQKIQKRAARVGFDWPDIAGAKAKILEELAEVEAAQSPVEIADEIGDLLFTVVNLARFYDVDSETALKSANAKFERRFRAMETRSNGRFAELSLAEKEEEWQQVKRMEANIQSE